MTTLRLRSHYYQQFDADLQRAIPAEGYGGWQVAELDLALEHTALVSMHAWDCGSPDEYPGWHRAVEYIPRSYAICREVFPTLLGAARRAGMVVLHVVAPAPSRYYAAYAGYRRAVELAGPEPAAPEHITADPTTAALWRFRADHVFPGAPNQADVERGMQHLDFPAEARPQGDEGIAENGHQLYALCRQAGISHLIYAGFAINWCLLLSPGGMADMQRRGLLCSALREAVTAVENKETARDELGKQLGLWRVSLAFGFVYEVADLVQALDSL